MESMIRGYTKIKKALEFANLEPDQFEVTLLPGGRVRLLHWPTNEPTAWANVDQAVKDIVAGVRVCPADYVGGSH